MTQQFNNIGNIPLYGAGFGIQTHFGIQLPPGANVAAYVRSTGFQSGDNAAIGDRLVATLAAGLARCRPGLGDYVICLPGHSESVTDALMLTNLVAGTTILGVGQGSNKPVFRWTTAGSQWPVSVADVTVRGLKLRLEGANGITKAILQTGANSCWVDNEIQVASGATNKATIAFEVGSGADQTTIALNYIYGTATHNVTDGIKVVAAVDRLRIMNNTMIFSATAGNGCVHFTAAATNVYLGSNDMYNTHTASTATVAVDNVAVDGHFAFNNSALTVGTATAPTSTGIVFAGANSLVRCNACLSTPTNNTSGITSPVADS